MNKTETSGSGQTSHAVHPVALLGRGRTVLSQIGARLVLLLLFAELPLVVMAVVAVLQNDRLRARDALSQAISQQSFELARLAGDLRAAVAIADATALLPPSVLNSPSDCAVVLASLAAANLGHVAAIAVTDARGAPICATPSAAAALRPSTAAAAELASAGGALRISRPLGHGNAVSVQLAPRPADVVDAANPTPALWVRHNGVWLPASAGAPGAPAPPAGLGQAAAEPMRVALPDGRLSLYSSLAVPPGLGAPGDRLAAGSDIRDAATASARTFVLRVAELAVVFVGEFLLIAAGVSLVASRPLKRLNTAVDRWRADNSFSFAPHAGGSREVAQLARSFAEATASLNQREQELRSSIAQQDLLMQEIHHRVKNNLQIVASLLNLQAGRIKAPEARAEFQSARDRVRALATLHRYLYASGELHMVDMRAFFAELCGQLFQAFNETEGARIALQIAAPDLNISSDQAVPIALIVTETVGNALKYAFPDRRHGRIEISFIVDTDNAGRLIIRDDGVGLDQRPESECGEGLGLQLVRGFAKQIGAKLTISTDCGTCYQLDMPIQRHRQNTIAFGARVVP